jgi:hypothetical protein
MHFVGLSIANHSSHPVTRVYMSRVTPLHPHTLYGVRALKCVVLS